LHSECGIFGCIVVVLLLVEELVVVLPEGFEEIHAAEMATNIREATELNETLHLFTWKPKVFVGAINRETTRNTDCCKPSDQPRNAARWEECSDLDEKSLTTFCRCEWRVKGIC